MSSKALVITYQQAMEVISKEKPEAAKAISLEIAKLKKEASDIIKLGTDEAFALRDAEGEIRAYKQRVHLSEPEGTLIQPVPNGPHVISAQGYEVWAEASGTTVIFPKEVMVNNRWCPNPFAERDETNRRILAVHARAVAFRFSSKGIPQVSDWSTIFDTPSYRLIDLLGKAKKFPQAFRLLPKRMDAPEENGTWTDYPFDESTALWVNTEHEEALSWYTSIINREKKSMDFAQTFAKRNALKHLSGLQKAPSKEWDLSVLCWRPVSGNIIKWDATQYVQLQQKVGELITGTGEDFAPNGSTIKRLETQSGLERVSDEEGFEELEKETDPEDQAIDVETEKPEPTVAYTDEEKSIVGNFEVTRGSFPEEFDMACKELGYNPKAPLSLKMMQGVNKKVNEIVDSQMGG